MKRLPSKDIQKTFTLRLRWLFFVFIPLGALLLIASLFHIQVQNGTYFREQADNQYVVASYNSFERGSIFFTEQTGNLTTAAGLKKGYRLTVNPQKISDPDVLCSDIVRILPSFDCSMIMQEFDSTRTYLELVNELDVDEAKKLKENLGERVQLYSEKWRVYPLETTASHLLGLMGYQGDEYAGRYGLERSYDDILKRTDQNLYTNFFARIFHNVEDRIDGGVSSEGDLVTSIEPQVQIFLESKLEEVQNRWSSDLTGGIIMDPQTGQILAMVTVPNFNPNDFSDASIEDFKNPLVENVYEMGSVMKPLVVAAAWDAGDINESTTYQDLGSVVVGKHTIYNFDKKGRGLVNVQEILNQSLNTGMVYIASRMDKDDFRSYFNNYGFTKTTGIDLPNEAPGLTSNLASTRDIEFANMSFGQGIAISPIAMVQAVSALANKGVTVHPHVGVKILYPSGLSKNIESKEPGTRVVSEETAHEVSRMLVNVFDAYNSGKTKILNYSVAAKTGTAQMPAPTGGYYSDRNLHSFVGYFPAYDPKFLVFLYTVYPKGIKYSSQTLLGPFRDTAEYLINYYNVPPDR